LKKLLTLLLFPTVCFGANIYISQNGTGDLSGVDISNTQSIATDNSVGYARGFGRDYWIVGYSTNGLCVGCNTSSGGAPLRFHFYTNAAIVIATGTPIYLGGLSDVSIDGGYNGFITITNQGSKLIHANSSAIISTTGPLVSNIMVLNLTISGNYRRTTNSDYTCNQDDTGGFYANGIGSNIIFSNDVFSDMQCCLNFLGGDGKGTNLQVLSCTFSNYDHGVIIGMNNYTNVTIAHNDFGATYNWDSMTNPPIYHHDGVHIQAAGKIVNQVIAANIYHDNGSNATAAVFMDFGTDATTSQTYNNVFLLSQYVYGNGFLSGAGMIDNNTMSAGVVPNAIGLKLGTGTIFINNIIQGVNTYIALTTTTNTIFSNNTYCVQSSGSAMFSTNGIGLTFPNWTNATQEANSIYTNISMVNQVDGTISNVLVKGVGADLSQIFNVDYNGTIRPAGNWDEGAFQSSIGPRNTTNGLFYMYWNFSGYIYHQ